MTQKDLYTLFSDLDDSTVTEAEEPVSPVSSKVPRLRVISSVAACICILAVGGGLLLRPAMQRTGTYEYLSDPTYSGHDNMPEQKADICEEAENPAPDINPSKTDGSSEDLSRTESDFEADPNSGDADIEGPKDVPDDAKSPDGGNTDRGIVQSTDNEEPTWDSDIPFTPSEDPIEDIPSVPISQELRFDGAVYSIGSFDGIMPADSLSELGEGTLLLISENENSPCTCYRIPGIDPVCGVAAFQSDSCVFSYYNASYIPKTWGEFCDALSLEDNLQFTGNGYFYKSEGNTTSEITYSGVEKETIFSILRSCSDAPCTQGMLSNGLGLGIDYPLLGFRNIVLSVTEDGYIETNLLGSGKRFFVGKETTDMLYSVIEDTCQKTETTYTYILTDGTSPVISQSGGSPSFGYETSIENSAAE